MEKEPSVKFPRIRSILDRRSKLITELADLTYQIEDARKGCPHDKKVIKTVYPDGGEVTYDQCIECGQTWWKTPPTIEF